MEQNEELEDRVAKLEVEVQDLRELLRRVGIAEGPFAEEEFNEYLARAASKRIPMGFL